MSIFKESFRDYVKQQFNVRQKLISKGNSDIGSNSRLAGGNGLAPGAFYAYGEKQCVIRMSSLVDLMEDIGLDLGGSRFESYKGETFARNFILEGGIMSDYARNNTDGEMVTRTVTDVRGGFPSSNKKVNLTYGDPSIAADPTDDGYGVVPMPGIVDANIETKSAYGSLRSAKVNFVCHNLRQLEVLELLYMRPGYPVLMEWGWSPYIGNDGNIVNEFPSISKNDWFWDDSQVSQERIQNEVIRIKQLTAGNYDGFIGFVTNFNYTARADGGFDCSTELISMGEVLDSLKGLNVENSYIDLSDLSEEEREKALYQTSLGFIIQNLNGLSADVDLSLIDKIVLFFKNAGSPVGSAIATLDTEAVENATRNKAFTNLVELLGPEVAASSIFRKDTTITSGDSRDGGITTQYSYIRWDALTELINNYVIPRTERNTPTVVLSNDLFKTDNTVEPILYSNYSDSSDNFIMDVSCNSKVCILPHQFEQFGDTEKNISFWGRIGLGLGAAAITSYSVVNSIFTFNFRQRDNLESAYKWVNAAITGERDILDSEGEGVQLTPEYYNRRIGGIFIGVEFLDEVYREVYNNRDATIGKFLKVLWGRINEETPLHNFGLRTEPEHPNIIQVIDLPITTKDLEELNYNELFKFNILSNDTIAREFKYDTQVPSSMKATIAINAQSGATSDDIDSVTFAAFNRSIKSRLHSTSEKFSEKEESNYANLLKARIERADRLRKLKADIRTYNENFFNNLEENGQNDNLRSISTGIKSIIKEAQSLQTYVEKSTSGYLKNQAVIPININLVLDGISGIIIGNVFRVDETRLPKAYRKRNIAFIVMGESQNITSGQDWTTTIRGQMIIFPTEEEINRKGIYRPQDLEISTAINEEIQKAGSQGFSVAESTDTSGIINTQIQQIEENLNQETIDERILSLEELGYTLEIQVNLTTNDPQWLNGNRDYVLANQIPYSEYTPFIRFE